MVFKVKVLFIDRKPEIRNYTVLAENEEEAKLKGTASWKSQMAIQGRDGSALLTNVLITQPDTLESQNPELFKQLRASMSAS